MALEVQCNNPWWCTFKELPLLYKLYSLMYVLCKVQFNKANTLCSYNDHEEVIMGYEAS